VNDLIEVNRTKPTVSSLRSDFEDLVFLLKKIAPFFGS